MNQQGPKDGRPRRRRRRRKTAAKTAEPANPATLGAAGPVQAAKPSRSRGQKHAAQRPSAETAVEAGSEMEEDEPELGIGSRVAPPPSSYDDEEPASEPRTRFIDDGESPASVEAQIRALEERLDGMIRRASSDEPEPKPVSLREQVQGAAREFVTRLSPQRSASDPTLEVPEDAASDAISELFSSEYYLKQWGRAGMRTRSEEVDEFGLDPGYEAKIRPLVEFLYRRYFRVETSGAANVPSSGRCIVVANHSGTLPLDGLMLRTALRLEHPARRELRWLAEDYIFYLPFIGAIMNRIGAVRACQENAERLLKNEQLLAVFPEGVKGIGKLYRDRYRLQRFGRGGFIRLCLRTQTPLVPCAVVGAEEMNPLLFRDEFVARVLGLPYLPVTPTFPWLGPAGLVPAPTKWKVVFGEVVRFEGYGPEAADDHVLVGRLAERVRGSIQGLLDTALQRRESVWFG